MSGESIFVLHLLAYCALHRVVKSEGISAFQCQLYPDQVEFDTELQAQGAFRFVISENSQWTPGKEIAVRLENSSPDHLRHIRFADFIIQAHDVLDRPVGRWVIGEGQKAFDCRTETDTLVNSFSSLLERREVYRTKVEAMFIPPEDESGIPSGEIDFNAAVMTADGQYWTNIRSIILTQTPVPEKPVEDSSDEADSVTERSPSKETKDDQQVIVDDVIPADDDHDLQKEGDIKEAKEKELKRQLNDEMNAVVEDTDNSREDAAYRETMEYEERKRQQERQRQEMMQFEKKDQQEYEARKRQEEEEEGLHFERSQSGAPGYRHNLMTLLFLACLALVA